MTVHVHVDGIDALNCTLNVHGHVYCSCADVSFAVETVKNIKGVKPKNKKKTHTTR